MLLANRHISRSLNKHNHGIANKIWKKLTQPQAVDLAGWVHNTNVNRLGYSPMQLMIGKVTNLPGFIKGMRVTDTNIALEIVKKKLENKMRSNSQI